VLAITLILVMFERLFNLGLFDPARGGDPLLYQHLFWIYSHPAVYIMILPVMGAVSEIIPTFARKKIFGYKAIPRREAGRPGERVPSGLRIPRPLTSPEMRAPHPPGRFPPRSPPKPISAGPRPPLQVRPLTPAPPSKTAEQGRSRSAVLAGPEGFDEARFPVSVLAEHFQHRGTIRAVVGEEDLRRSFPTEPISQRLCSRTASGSKLRRKASQYSRAIRAACDEIGADRLGAGSRAPRGGGRGFGGGEGGRCLRDDRLRDFALSPAKIAG